MRINAVEAGFRLVKSAVIFLDLLKVLRLIDDVLIVVLTINAEQKSAQKY